MANTEILIKRSLANTTPSTLNQGELAYSYASNTLFIGTPGSDGYLEIGGLAKDFSGNYQYGANTYGDTTHIPVITIAANGLITNVTTSEISTTLSISGDSGSNNLSLVTDTLSLIGGDGITTTVDGNEVTFDVDTTVLRANTEGGPQYISSDVQISGNLTVQGTTTYVQSAINQTNDSLIELAANNTVGDVLDIGFYGKHEGTDGTVVTGLVRNAGTSDYYLFDNINIGDQENLTSNIITQGSLEANGASLYSYQFLATQNEGSAGGFSFSGTEGGHDTGMFSPADGQLDFYSNAEKIISANNGGGIVLQYGANLGDKSDDAIYFGQNAGQNGQGNEAVAIGKNAGSSDQGFKATAIGSGAGQTDQSSFAVAVGLHAGQTTQGTASVAIGHAAGQTSQGQDAVAVGVAAGENSQGIEAVAVGNRAGAGYDTPQGDYAVAIGSKAGIFSQAAYSIAINASGENLNPTEAGLYVDPIRANNATGGNVTVYNTTTKEVVYTDATIDNNGLTLANGTVISDAESGLFIDPIREDATSADILYYNSDTKEVTYGTLADIRADVLSNGTFSWTISADNGSLSSNVGTTIAASANSVVIGENVDLTNANYGRIALGISAASISQSAEAIAIGDSAGYNTQGESAIAIGSGAGNVYQGFESVAIGSIAGETNQGQHAVAIGQGAGNNSQDYSAVAIGQDAGSSDQSFSAVAIGRWAGETSQGWDSVAVGRRAGRTNQGGYSVALGWAAADTNQGQHSVAIGESAAENTQSAFAVAIGSEAGNYLQSWGATALGTQAGYSEQGLVAVAIGSNAGRYTQSQGAVAVGRRAGETTQGYYATALGNRAGRYNQGQYAVAIGAYAGDYNQAQRSIVLNASGSALDAATSGLFINPIAYTATQDADFDGLMFYNASTKEVRYSYALDGGSF
jgi:hypothetical protein